MTVAAVQELFAYNAWANRRFFAALEPLPAKSYFRDLKSSHGGLHGTLCHIVWAEQLWLNRWLAQPHPAVPQGRDLTTLAAAQARWEAIETERDAFLAGLIVGPIGVHRLLYGAGIAQPVAAALAAALMARRRAGSQPSAECARV